MLQYAQGEIALDVCGLEVQQAGLGPASRRSLPLLWCAVSDVVLDNLKEGVITPDLYEPEINRLYVH
jgi:hypothetical protein